MPPKGYKNIKFGQAKLYLPWRIIDYDENSDESITFEGTKDNIDYANYKNKYFLDIYNVNQLLKRSKYIDTIDGTVLKYELNNSEKQQNTTPIENSWWWMWVA